MDELCAAGREEIEGMLLGVDTLFPELPRLTVPSAAERKIRCGAAVSFEGEPGRCLVYSESGALLALGELRDGELRTVKSFFES